MTKKKSKEISEYSLLELSMYRARRIAADIEDKTLTEPDQSFLIQALRRIGEGEDANTVFQTRAGRGQKKSLKSRQKAERLTFILPWISSVIRPHPDGRGLDLEDAFSEAAEEFGLSEDSLRTYWFDYPMLREPSFSPPISSLPIRRKNKP